MKMFVVYTGCKELNVRREPGGEVEGAMFPGESAYAERIDNGWAKLEGGGYVNVAFCSVELVADGGIAEEPVIARAPAVAQAVGAALEAAEQGGRSDGDELPSREKLEGMTNPMLYDLAKSLGASVRKRASKPEMIDAILNC